MKVPHHLSSVGHFAYLANVLIETSAHWLPLIDRTSPQYVKLQFRKAGSTAYTTF
ncbi:hypothetical protein ACFU5O_20540 [Streptomyces sp. NPDC057445]|uniref:hypothetical protein n=1 Tax=Streptomyces sp. NPDC057445 TaxID=3346136 RepID=UPI0036D0AACA